VLDRPSGVGVENRRHQVPGEHAEPGRDEKHCQAGLRPRVGEKDDRRDRTRNASQIPEAKTVPRRKRGNTRAPNRRDPAATAAWMVLPNCSGG
jgi:hypothetical protein